MRERRISEFKALLQNSPPVACVLSPSDACTHARQVPRDCYGCTGRVQGLHATGSCVVVACGPARCRYRYWQRAKSTRPVYVLPVACCPVRCRYRYWQRATSTRRVYGLPVACYAHATINIILFHFFLPRQLISADVAIYVHSFVACST